MRVPLILTLVAAAFFNTVCPLCLLAGDSTTEKTMNRDNNLKKILFLGDSITAGYGLDPSQAYPALIQNKITALGLPYQVINAGLSGDTTSAGEKRLTWLLRQQVDILVIALGANDGLRGIPPATIQSNLENMINYARSKTPQTEIILAGMKMPPNLGRAFTSQYEAVFPAVARKTGVKLVPFLLDRVGGIETMNQADLIHPNAEGQKIIAETIWTTLKPVLSSKSRTQR